MSIESIERLGVGDMATELGIHPFDLIRILVAEDRLPPELRFDPSEAGSLSRAGGIEAWWDRPRRDDEIGARALLRDLAAQLVQRGVVGENATRLDNLLRGLDAEDQLLVRAFLQELLSMGLLASRNSPTGLRVSIVEGQEYVVADLAEGGTVPPQLAAVWTEA